MDNKVQTRIFHELCSTFHRRAERSKAPPWKTRPVLKYQFKTILVRRVFKLLFFVANTSYIIRLKRMTMTDHFSWPPEYISMNSYLNHTKNNQIVRAEKMDFARSLNWSVLKLSI